MYLRPIDLLSDYQNFMVVKKNVDLATRLCLKDVTVFDNGVFCEKCELNRSPGDSHCLLHSFISYLAFQNGTIITLSELIHAIITETMILNTTSLTVHLVICGLD